MIRRYLLFAMVLVLSVGVATFLNQAELRAGIVPATGGDQPSSLKFSHQFHLKEAGAECVSCHPGAQTSSKAADNLASTHDQCSSCHQQEVSENCAYCHADPNNVVARVQPDRALIFSHTQHLGLKDVQCTSCHTGLEETDYSGAKGFPGMATCNTCHNDRKATNTCEACHLDFVTLLPTDHKRSDFVRNHRDEARLGSLEVSCRTCHTERFCFDCHQGAGLKAFRPRDLRVEPRPKTSTKDNPKRTVLQNVHELNYRYTHGIDAKGKQAECASCHSVQTFCVPCHQAGGNINQGAFKPRSHAAAGFTTLGRGSGGGLHAEEARRDIESCMSCHDVEGRDPTCMTCHTSTGQVR